MQNELYLKIAEEKSGIHHAKEGITFLGYNMRTYTGHGIRKVRKGGHYTLIRTVSEQMQLHVPQEKVMHFCQKHGYGDYNQLRSMHKTELLQRSEAEIILTYNAELRGLANYYCPAYRAKLALGKLAYIWQGSLLKTLARKHQSTVSQTAKRRKKGTNFAYEYEVQGKPMRLKVFSLRELTKAPDPWASVDRTPKIYHLARGRTELIQRLNAQRCEYCGREQGYFAVHHVRKLKDVQDGKQLWQHMMAAMRRKTLVLCVPCHQELHAGTLPDWRARVMKGESRMR